MFPMSLAESGDSTRTVSLSGLFDGTFTLCILDEDSTEATKLIELACRGGWPEALDLDAARAQSIAREHLRALLVDTVPRQGGGSEIASRLLSPIARTLGQSATQAILFSDMNREPLAAPSTPPDWPSCPPTSAYCGQSMCLRRFRAGLRPHAHQSGFP